jgi:hypothetical protein
MNARLLLGGLKSYLPLPGASYKGTGGTVSGAYCYAVWLRHLTLIARYLEGAAVPRGTVVELGPGDSIGLGLAAILSGTDTYIALDVLEHASAETNLRVLDELVALYRRRAPIPDATSFPRLFPRAAAHDFPAGFFDESLLSQRTGDAYVAQLRDALRRVSPSAGPVQYRCPWNERSVDPGSADLVISQVALQDMDHTQSRDDLRANIHAMARWLRPGGVMSHQVDFSCPGGEPWNHHWAYGDLSWAIVRGRRPYYVNRVPLSGYAALFEEAGCRVVGVERVERPGLPPARMASRFRTLPESDHSAAAALIVATRR